MDFSRRFALKGMLGGSAVTVGLPLLNVFLNGNGNAMADGTPMPVRFGTWYWHLGMQRNIFVPDKVGADFDLKEESAAFAPIKQHMNLLTNFTAFRDDCPLLCHSSGWIISRSGIAPKANGDNPGETLDITVSNQIGRTTRFKTLTATATGDVRDTHSYENQTTETVPEFSPIAFYQRVFGPDFQDPNAPSFTPNPKVMVRKSVLSGVMDDVKKVNTKIGSEDKARLDQYLTGLRHLERQFDQQLTKPTPIAACKAPKALDKETQPGNESSLITSRHKMMTDLMVMAVACDQTRVFNMSYSGANTTKPGYEKPHHTCTHEERLDEKLGYQVNASWFTRKSMEAWAYYVEAFTKVKEGDGTLLDNVFIQADTDVGYARVHSLDGYTAMTAGRAGGKVKTGIHVAGNGTSICRLGYTGLKLMGCDVSTWGTKSNNNSNAISEILA
ncbi:MAG: DUF1552 domain-containing protein [Rhodospirillaceae bacterium]